MAAPGQAKKSSRKVGRNRDTCAAYRASQRREVNKARRILRMMRKHPNDKTGPACIERLKGILFSAQRKSLGLTL